MSWKQTKKRLTEGFPDDIKHLSQDDLWILQPPTFVKWIRKLKGKRFKWLADNSHTPREREYFHLFEGYVIAGQSGP